MFLRVNMRAGWIAATVALLLATGARADSIAQWDTTGYLGTEAVVTPTQMAAGVTADDIIRSSLLVGNAGAGNYNSAGWNNAGQYVQLGFTTTSEWDVTSLLLATRSSATGPGLMDVNASVDGGAFVTVAQINQAPGANYIDQLLPLNLLVNSSLVIQFTPDNNTDAAGTGTIGVNGTWRIGDYENSSGAFSPITLSGSAVPEPSSIIVLGIGLAGVGVLTRVRRKPVA